MMKKTTQVLLASGLLGLSSGLSAQGIASDSGLGFEVGGGYYFTDNKRQVDDGPFGAIGAEYRLGEHWAIQGWFYRTADLDQSDSANASSRGDASIQNAHLDLTYYFTNSRWQPYVSVGGGQSMVDYKDDVPGSEDDNHNQWNAGLGLKVHLTPGFFVRAEARAFRGRADRTDVATYASLGYMFGQEPKAPPILDSDGDGVLDDVDQCPNTPAGVAVDEVGCPLDSDGDGVPDYLDECPDTAPGSEVDEVGCYLVLSETVVMKVDVKAAFDSTKIGVDGVASLQEIAGILRKYPGATAVVEGHTDSSGPAEYNQRLSERRAEAVAGILSDDFGIDASRLETVGYGETRPEADNSTAEGRAANRRVMVIMEAEVEEAVIEGVELIDVEVK